MGRLLGGPSRRAESPVEQRATYQVPAGVVDGGTYASVDTSQFATPLQSVAIRSTVDLIASLASELPAHVFNMDTGEQVKAPPNLADPDGEGHGLADWVYQLLVSWLMRGNAYGSVLEYRRGRPTQVVLHYPDVVFGQERGGGGVDWFVNGKKHPESSFWHRRVNPIPGHVLGFSPIDAHATTIGTSLASARFGRQWFTDGAHPSALLTNEHDLTQEAADVAKRRWMAAMAGSRTPAVLGNGWDYKAVQLTPEQSQYLKTQGMSEAQCCRIFGPGFAEVLGYESGGSMTYANVVERRADVLVLSMDRWLNKVDRVLSGLVAPRQEVRLDRDALLRSTTLQRYQAHALALSSRWKTVNEVRADEDMAPVAWGDEPNVDKVDVPGIGGV